MFFISGFFGFTIWIFCSARLTKLHALVGAEESHEHWRLDDFNSTITVDIEVAPGFIEIGVHVFSKGWTTETLVGSKNLLSGVLHTCLAHHEGTGWLTTDLGSIIELLNWSSLLESVFGDHGSHEDVIRVRREVWSNDSLVLTIGGTILDGFPGIVDWVFFDYLFSCDANVGLLVRLGIRGLGLRLDLNGALVWWSGVSSLSRVSSIAELSCVVISMSKDGGKLPDWLIPTLDLNCRLVWWSGIGLSGGMVTVGFLDTGISSVVLNGFERPDWLSGRGVAKKASNSEGKFHV